MPKRDLDDFAKRHNLTQESLLELGEILKGAPTSLPTSEVYTIVDDLNLPPNSPLPLELPPDPNSNNLPGRVVASTKDTQHSYSFDEEEPTREFPIIGIERGESIGRYRDLGLIGHGGMGEVRRIRDLDLNRVMAMKIISEKIQGKPLAVSRFVEEAQATAQLQHPGVVPVHEMGQLGDGRIYFTMQEIRGRTFGSVIHRLHESSTELSWGTSPGGWTIRRLLEALRHACETVAYAHKRGVVHRDLKPENIMVGQHGEVLIVDWGLAKVMNTPRAQRGEKDESPLETNRSTDDAFATIQGAIAGTPAYMPPEQAKGEINQIGPHSDVYALGAILYELLSGRPPYVGGAKSVLKQLLKGPPESLRDTAGDSFDTLGFDFTLDALDTEGEGHSKIPPELVVIAEKAMARNPRQRYANAQELTDALSSWLDGSMRTERALRVVDRAIGVLEIAASHSQKAAEIEEHGRELLEEIKPWEPEERKVVIWKLEDEAKALRHRSRVKLIEAEQLLQAALTYDSELLEAHKELANLYLNQHREHEKAGKSAEATRAYELLRLHVRALPEEARINFIAYLHGGGSINIHTDPPGAEVHIYVYEEVDRRLQTRYLGLVGTTPLQDYPIGMGSYLLRLKAPGRAEVSYPIDIRRQEVWSVTPPGESEPRPVPLPLPEVLGPDDIYIPEGWTTIGGDGDLGAFKPTRAWIDGFLIRRYPVTNQEYLLFINDLQAQKKYEEVKKHIPCDSLGTDYWEYYKKQEDNTYGLGEDREGDKWLEQWPVMQVSWASAVAYCAWYSEKTGQQWRLPAEFEWEKAARGVDQRRHPWGHHVDPSWCRIRTSLSNRAILTTVDDYPTDSSPYGVRGMGGNVADWCLDTFQDTGPNLNNGQLVLPNLDLEDTTSMRIFRGGIWISYEMYTKTYERFASTPKSKTPYLGFRLVRPL
jgi:eukaryotic-like serine/threonine-protein kinase